MEPAEAAGDVRRDREDALTDGEAKEAFLARQQELRSALAGLTLKGEGAFRRSLLYSAVVLLLGTAWIVLTFREVLHLRAEMRELDAQRVEKATELESSRRELESVKSQMADLKSLLDAVRYATRMTDDKLKEYRDEVRLIEDQKRAAEEELAKIVTTQADRNRRAGISIRYYFKRGDPRNIDDAMDGLRQRGFDVLPPNEGGSEPDMPTNAVWIVSPGLMQEDIKVVAYNLIRVGIQIRHIGAYPYPGHLKGKPAREKIWVGADKGYANDPLWTVERIRATPKF